MTGYAPNSIDPYKSGNLNPSTGNSVTVNQTPVDYTGYGNTTSTVDANGYYVNPRSIYGGA